MEYVHVYKGFLDPAEMYGHLMFNLEVTGSNIDGYNHIE